MNNQTNSLNEARLLWYIVWAVGKPTPIGGSFTETLYTRIDSTNIDYLRLQNRLIGSISIQGIEVAGILKTLHYNY